MFEFGEIVGGGFVKNESALYLAGRREGAGENSECTSAVDGLRSSTSVTSCAAIG